jgi:tetrahydromethanopterin S-methyltransferase subunit H
MTHWNHRVVKEVSKDGFEWLSVREVFYNDDGSIYGYTDCAADVSGESIEDLREYTQWILDCLDKDILIDSEVEFVDPDAIVAEELGFDSVEEYLESLDEY